MEQQYSESRAHSWFAIDRGLKNNPKIMSLPCHLLKAWIILNCATDDNGVLPVDLLGEYYEWNIPPKAISREDLGSAFAELIERRCIDERLDGRFEMHDFLDWQPRGRSAASSEKIREQARIRKQNQRARQKAASRPEQAGLQGIPVAAVSPSEDAPTNLLCVDVSTIDQDPLEVTRDEVTHIERIEESLEKKRTSSPTPSPSRHSKVELSREDRLAMTADFMAIYPVIGNQTAAASALDQLFGQPSPELGMSAKELLYTGIPNRAYYFDVVKPGILSALESEQWTKDFGTYIPDAVTFLVGDPKNPNKTGRQWLHKLKKSQAKIAEIARKQADRASSQNGISDEAFEEFKRRQIRKKAS